MGTKIVSLLNTVSALIPEEVKEAYNRCLPKFKSSICESLVPRCSSKCQPLQICESETKKLNNDCMELIDYLKWIVTGGQFRDIAASHMGPLSTKLIDKWTDMVLGKSEDLISSSTSECVSETFTEKCILGETHTEPEQKKEDLEETKEEDESKNDESKVDEPKVDESKNNELDDDDSKDDDSKDNDSKDDDSNEEDTTQEEKPKEEPKKDEESKKEEDSKCEKIEGADGKTYYGTVASGFTRKQVVAGADKLISLLGMTGSFLGAEVG